MTTVDKATGEILDHKEHLLITLEEAKENTRKAREIEGRIEMSVIAEIQAEGGTAFPSETYICELKVINSYDQTKFTLLKEELNETEMDHAWEEEWDETKVHPAKFNTVKLKSIVNKRGGRAKEIFEDAMIPGAVSLTFKRRD